MNLSKKRKLSAKVLGVGVNRIIFNNERLEEIKEAITRNDILDLYKNKVIGIKQIKGTRRAEKIKRKIGVGNIRKKIVNRKRDYARNVRKLRNYLKKLKTDEKINKDRYYDLRKKIKQNAYKNIKQLAKDIK